jgi:long-chain acyl-CoA synthetase
VDVSTNETVPALLRWRIDKTPDAVAYQFPDASDRWKKLTWTQVGERVDRIAQGLLALGLGLEDRVAIASTTRVEWILVDFGILTAGGATTTIYPSNTPEECSFILNDSGTRIVFAEDDSQVAKLVQVRSELESVIHVINMTGRGGQNGWVLSMADLERQGEVFAAEHSEALETRRSEIGRHHLATLIYTSGTTGQPKGVELLHDCWVYEAEATEAIGFVSEEDHQYLWLPLSHSFGKLLEVMQLRSGFMTTVDGRIPRLVDNLEVVQPTFMAAAPRIFEKVYNRVVTGAQEAGGVKLRLFRWSVAVGREVSQIRQAGREPKGLLALKYAIADILVFSKLKQRFGGKVRFFISGSAPLSLEMAEFFHAADILILEGYGLTESSAASFVNRPDEYKFGTVGKPVPGTSVKIAEADGEILLQGRGIMRGYYNLPDVSAETLTEDRWLCTGDIGEIDDDGFLRITDRKKNLIKTSGGKYVAPQKLEGSLKAACPYLSQVLVHGDRRNFCSALVTLDPESIPSWAADHGMEGWDERRIAADPRTKAMVQEAVDQLNVSLARHETLKKFAILPEDFSVETGELTASLKVKRKVVETKYADVLDGFYTGALAEV